jgi:uncharacterized protein YqeY
MAALKQRISDEMKAAFLGGDRFRGDILRNLKAAILNEEVAKQKRDEGLSDAEIEAVIAREVKRRVESARLYRDNDRPELAEPEEQEMTVLAEFLPEQMSDAELRGLIEAKIAELGATGPQDMGKVIGAVKADAGSAVDGALLAQTVKEILANK